MRLAPFALVLLLVAAPLSGQVAGGAGGYDATLEAIEPDGAAADIGLAGENPANIGRYLAAAAGGAGGIQLSPDGETLLFQWSITGEPQLWSMPASGGQPRRLTFGGAVGAFAWSPDGRRIFYSADNDGDEQPAYYLLAADGSAETEALPAVANGFRVFGGFSGGTSIVYASTERNGLDFDLYRADLSTGESVLVREGSYGFYPGRPSPDGRWVTVSEPVGEDSNNLHLLDLSTGDLTPVSVPDRRAAHESVRWLQDGSGFYLVSNVEREFQALMFRPLEGGLEVVEEIDADIEAVVLCGTDDRWLIRLANVGGYHEVRAVERETGEAVQVPDLPEGVYGISCSPNSSRAVVRVTGWRTIGDLFEWDLATGAVAPVFEASWAGLNPGSLVRPASVTLPARDGIQIQGLLYLPEESSRLDEGPPPVVFRVHGGPTAQSRPTFSPVAQYYADRGIAVFEPNVRGSTGFGHTYVTLDDREKRLDSVRDLVDMLAYLGEREWVDAERAIVSGGSYGGYAVNAALANFPGHFIAGISLFGVADWVTALEIASPGLKASDRIEYGDISEQRWWDYYTENSPIRYADRIDVPVLYSHGVRDPRIDIAETEVMVKNLRSRGVSAPFIRFLDEGHGWRKLENRLFYQREEARFVAEQFGLLGRLIS